MYKTPFVMTIFTQQFVNVYFFALLFSSRLQKNHFILWICGHKCTRCWMILRKVRWQSEWFSNWKSKSWFSMVKFWYVNSVLQAEHLSERRKGWALKEAMPPPLKMITWSREYLCFNMGYLSPKWRLQDWVKSL